MKDVHAISSFFIWKITVQNIFENNRVHQVLHTSDCVYVQWYDSCVRGGKNDYDRLWLIHRVCDSAWLYVMCIISAYRYENRRNSQYYYAHFDYWRRSTRKKQVWINITHTRHAHIHYLIQYTLLGVFFPFVHLHFVRCRYCSAHLIISLWVEM